MKAYYRNLTLPNTVANDKIVKKQYKDMCMSKYHKEDVPAWIDLDGHKKPYYRWSKSPCKNLDYLQWNDKLQEFIDSGLYCIYVCPNSSNLEHCPIEEFVETPMVVIDDTASDTNNFMFVRHPGSLFSIERFICGKDGDWKEQVGGSKACKHINEMLEEEYGVSLYKAFGKVDPKVFDCFQSSAIIETQVGIFDNCTKGDFSSAYPFQATKPLPDSKKVMRFSGQVEPTEEFPFAFYTKSHHRAVYGEADTRKLIHHPLYRNYLTNKGKNGWIDETVKPEDDETILFGVSDYSLANAMRKMYNLRKDDATAKSIMVCMIGYMRSVRYNKYCYQGHLSSVIYLRHIQAMCDKFDEIIANGGIPIMFATDSIVWKGKNKKIAVKDKEFGVFHLEYENVSIAIRGTGMYGIALNEHEELLEDTIKRQSVGAGWNPKTLTDVMELGFTMIQRKMNESGYYEVKETQHHGKK